MGERVKVKNMKDNENLEKLNENLLWLFKIDKK